MSTISLRERDNVLEVAGDLFSKFVTDTYYSEVGLERKLDGIDLSPYAGIEVSYDIRFAYKRDIPRAVDLRLWSLNGSENGDYRSAFATCDGIAASRSLRSVIASTRTSPKSRSLRVVDGAA